jgi:hypothetical protein
MDWAAVLVIVAALGVWIALVRFILPRFGIQTG